MWSTTSSLTPKLPRHLPPYVYRHVRTCMKVSSKSHLPGCLNYLHDLKDDSEVYNYTSGRWLYNEAKRLEERRVMFDVPALLHAAAASLSRPVSDVQSFSKIAEGGFNRVFRITMQDGVSLIARIPYPSYQPKQLTIASEVATMDLLRQHGIPTPAIYHYDSQADNTVGTEYILMQDMPGRALGTRWFELDAKQRVKVLAKIVDIEAKLYSIDLPAFGSIFHDKDLPMSFHREPISRSRSSQQFCIGPDVSLKFWFGTRERLNIRHGAALSAEEVLIDGAAKELAWLEAHGRARFPFDRVFRDITNFQKSDPKQHMASLEAYMQVASQLVPEEKWLRRPVLRHPDLNANNIFVNDALDITGIIDWQHSTILPLFLGASIPKQLQNYGDPVSEELSEPLLPSLKDLDEEEKQSELELYRRRHVHYFYVGATAAKFPDHFHALTQQGGMFLRRLYQHASEPWEGNNIPLATHLALVPVHWKTLGGGHPCPLPLDKDTTEVLVSQLEKQELTDQQMSILRNYLRISDDGWVSKDEYDHAQEEAAQFKVKAVSMADDDHERDMTIRHWPFEDHDEDE